ncbi:MAG: DUF4340 domain-containing protein [Leptospirillia bacterium]
MKLKTLVILLVFVLLLAGLFFAGRIDQENAGGTASGQLLALDPERIARVVLESASGRTVLVRKDGEWMLTEPISYPADSALVASTIGALVELVSDGVISSNPERASVFEVDASRGLSVSVFEDTESGQPLARLTLGKLSPDFGHTYVTLGDRPEVHQVRGTLRFRFERDAGGWRDKTVLAFDAAEIHRIDLAAEGMLSVEREADGASWRWAVDHPTPASALDPEKVGQLVRFLATLKAHDFVDEVPDASAEPLLIVTLHRGAGNPIDLTVEDDVDGRYRVVVDADPQRYLVHPGPLAELAADPVSALSVTPEQAPAGIAAPPS